MTLAEWRLWCCLRDHQLEGFKFRRQMPIGRYIVDFACLSARLFVEVDGPGHDDRNLYDTLRTRWLEARGYRLLRFSADDVRDNLEGVVDSILLELRRHSILECGD